VERDGEEGSGSQSLILSYFAVEGENGLNKRGQKNLRRNKKKVGGRRVSISFRIGIKAQEKGDVES